MKTDPQSRSLHYPMDCSLLVGIFLLFPKASGMSPALRHQPVEKHRNNTKANSFFYDSDKMHENPRLPNHAVAHK